MSGVNCIDNFTMH